MLAWQRTVSKVIIRSKKMNFWQLLFLSSLLHLCFFVSVTVLATPQINEPVHHKTLELEMVTVTNEARVMSQVQTRDYSPQKVTEHYGGGNITQSVVAGGPVVTNTGVSNSPSARRLVTGESVKATGTAPSPVANSGEKKRVTAPGNLLQDYLARLERLKEYPYMARKRSQEGTVLLRVAFAPEGSVLAVAIIQSSGYENLDKAALQLIYGGGAFEHNTTQKMEIEIPITYSLKG